MHKACTHMHKACTKQDKKLMFIQGFAESLQHYTKIHKVKSADRSIYGAQVSVLLITLPAADYNLSPLLALELGPLIKFMPTNQINCPLNATSYVCCKGLEKPCNFISRLVSARLCKSISALLQSQRCSQNLCIPTLSAVHVRFV